MCLCCVVLCLSCLVWLQDSVGAAPQAKPPWPARSSRRWTFLGWFCCPWTPFTRSDPGKSGVVVLTHIGMCVPVDIPFIVCSQVLEVRLMLKFGSISSLLPVLVWRSPAFSCYTYVNCSFTWIRCDFSLFFYSGFTFNFFYKSKVKTKLLFSDKWNCRKQLDALFLECLDWLLRVHTFAVWTDHMWVDLTMLYIVEPPPWPARPPFIKSKP